MPKKEELIDSIKALDDDIEHVSLNLIKCNFDAVEKDVSKTFPEFHFIKVKKYNPGSFEVIFETKIDAINFIRNEFDKKILGRRFFIKMGRQQKEHAEKWTAIGHVPKEFKKGPKGNSKEHMEKKEGENTNPTEDKGEKKEEKAPKEETKAEHKPEHKAEHKPVQKQEHPKVEYK